MTKSKTLPLRHFDPTKDAAHQILCLINVARKVNKRVKFRRPRKAPEIIPLGGVVWVPANKCFINYDGQRWPEPKHIKKKMLEKGKWDPVSATPLYCRYDPNEDRYYIADGQQHAIAWVLVHGENTELPITYIESTDSTIEHRMFKVVNTSGKKISRHDEHMQDVKAGDKTAQSVERVLKRSNCHTGREPSKQEGCITHVSHLYKCHKEYGVKKLTNTLNEYRTNFAGDKVDGGMFAGMLLLEETLIEEGTYTDDLMGDIWSTCGKYFDTGKECADACKEPVNEKLKGLGSKLEELHKIACGAISMYNGLNNTQYASKLYNDLDVPIMKSSHGILCTKFDPSTYGTRKIYNEICETGDLSLAWAYLAGRENHLTDASDIKTLHGMCEEACVDCGVELDYGRGRNGEGKAEENRPSVAHDQSVAKTNDFSIDNVRGVICTTCNRRESDNPNYVPDFEFTKQEELEPA